MMPSGKLSQAPRTVRRKLVSTGLGTKQALLGVFLFVCLTTLLAINILPPNYVVEPIEAQRLLGVALLVLGILILSGLYLYDFRPLLFRTPSKLLLLGVIFLVITVMAKVFHLLSVLHAGFWGFLIPVAAVGMVVTVLFDSHLAVMLVISSSVMVAFLTDGNFGHTAAALLGGLIAVFTSARLRERSELPRAGLLTGLGLGFFSVTVGLITRSIPTALIDGSVGFTNGIFSAMLALGSLPFIERHFGIVTSMRLLELSNPNQPLLRDLMIRAPGTYNHSIMVGNLAEAAAEAIGADTLLVRVGAYYHDIGKMKRPTFFIENQRATNRHQAINPQLSCLVITSHVKEGLDLARKSGLPPEITDLIDQHHGKGIVSYFYHQAKKKGSQEKVCEETFRYNGRKPRSREAVVLMLADAAEAAAKRVHNPSQARFEQLVNKLIEDRMNDGQLSESEITLAELKKVGQSFTQTLTGVYHPRVDYPEDAVPARTKTARAKVDRIDRKPAAKRAG